MELIFAENTFVEMCPVLLERILVTGPPVTGIFPLDVIIFKARRVRISSMTKCFLCPMEC